MVNYHKSYKHKLDASFQQVESISFSDFNLFYRFIALLIVAVLFLTWSKSKLKTFMVFSFLFMICNAFSTGAFANILMRLNTRGATIFIVFALLFIIQRIGDSSFLLKFMASSKFKISSKR
jgi:tryptophan-rich sensory protein